jgi:mitochondrial fission protein ELM1
MQPEGWQTALPPALWPAPLSALPSDQHARVAAPWPDIWIATGRRSIPYSLKMKALSGGMTFVVQAQDPRTSLDRFDLVVPPKHDRVEGTNVFPILGPPTWWSDPEIAAAQERFPNLTAEPGRKLLISIGGDSKTHKLIDAKVAELESLFQRLPADGHRLWVTISRRTPEVHRVRLRRAAANAKARFWESEQLDGPNPYLAWLSLCDAALVTEDSANLLADPAFFGKPTHILRLAGRSDRFDRLHQGFVQRGSARWFTGRIERWGYMPVREAERAADEILRLWIARNPPSTPS